jgi:hypothetical protein
VGLAATPVEAAVLAARAVALEVLVIPAVALAVLVIPVRAVPATLASGGAALAIPADLEVLVILADGRADPDIQTGGDADLAVDTVTVGDTVVMVGDVAIRDTAHMPDRVMATMATPTAASRRDMDGIRVLTITMATNP